MKPYDCQDDARKSYARAIGGLHDRLWHGFKPELDYAVACCYPRQEIAAAADLVRRGYVVFLPMLTLHETRRKRGREARTALFPGYCFVSLPDADTLTPQRVRAVSRLLFSNGGPAIVPGAELAWLYNAEQVGIFDETQEVVRLNAGDPVKIVLGPLAGFIGKLKSTDGVTRCEVLFDLLGKETTVRMGLEKVRAAV